MASGESEARNILVPPLIRICSSAICLECRCIDARDSLNRFAIVVRIVEIQLNVISDW
jgi:hypothetical protein